MSRPRVVALIAAGGSGTRAGAGRNKLFLPLGGEPVLLHAVRGFLAHPAVAAVAIVAQRSEWGALERCLAREAGRDKLAPWIVGGAQRQDSVYNGLESLAPNPPERVLVHDGARPFCSGALIGRVLAGLDSAAGVIPVLPVTDTVRRIEGAHSQVVPRAGLYRTQTPQGFRWEPLWQAHRAARARGEQGTDDAQLLEAAGTPLTFVEGDAENLKITTPDDLRYAEWLLRNRVES